MVKLEQAIILDPENELHFKGPYEDVSTCYLKLNNPTDQRICFKLKTTAPKVYCVRPNSGVIEPKDSVTVAVMLYCNCVEQTDKGKHKFMVQTLYVPDGYANLEELWREASPSSLMNSKLRCVFDFFSEAGQQTPKDLIGSATEESLVAGGDSNNDEFATIMPTPANATSSEEGRLDHENRQLRTRISALKQENSMLKEKNSFSRKVTKTSNTTTHAEPSDGGNSTVSKMSWLYSHIYILGAVIFLLGLLIGQYILH